MSTQYSSSSIIRSSPRSCPSRIRARWTGPLLEVFDHAPIIYPLGVSRKRRVAVMKVTKYEHACLVIEKGDETLVIDPGAFTMPLTDVGGVVGMVITHEHADHWTAEQLERILDRNPGSEGLRPSRVVAAAAGTPIDEVVGGDEREIGGFRPRLRRRQARAGARVDPDRGQRRGHRR